MIFGFLELIFLTQTMFLFNFNYLYNIAKANIYTMIFVSFFSNVGSAPFDILLGCEML